MNTLNENYKAISLIRPKSITATETGTGVDVTQYEDDAMAVMHLGALGGTVETFIGTVETSTDGGSNYTTALTFGTITGAEDNYSAAGRVNLSGVTHIRGKIAMSGSSASLVSMSVLARAKTGGSSVNSTTPAA